MSNSPENESGASRSNHQIDHARLAHWSPQCGDCKWQSILSLPCRPDIHAPTVGRPSNRFIDARTPVVSSPPEKPQDQLMNMARLAALKAHQLFSQDRGSSYHCGTTGLPDSGGCTTRNCRCQPVSMISAAAHFNARNAPIINSRCHVNA